MNWATNGYWTPPPVTTTQSVESTWTWAFTKLWSLGYPWEERGGIVWEKNGIIRCWLKAKSRIPISIFNLVLSNQRISSCALLPVSEERHPTAFNIHSFREMGLHFNTELGTIQYRHFSTFRLPAPLTLKSSVKFWCAILSRNEMNALMAAHCQCLAVNTNSIIPYLWYLQIKYIPLFIANTLIRQFVNSRSLSLYIIIRLDTEKISKFNEEIFWPLIFI